MRQIFFLVLLFITTGLFAQAPSNYTNINGRYRWIAGMFDSTFHIPKGTTTSLRTGGSTNAGALFYRTTDSSVYYYTGTQWLKVAGASGFVPYTGATQNVNLGQFGLTTKFVQFDTSSQAVTDRRLQWSNAEGTLQFGMTNGSTITQRIGLEQFARVRNLQGDTIEAGDVVYVSGASGDRASVKLADNRADSTSSKTLGVATEQILPNDVGLVGTFGVVGKLNLSAFTAGDVVYLDSIPGKLTKVKPQAPYHMVFVGVVERANAGNGLLFVNVQNGYELEELHNVRITSPVRNNAILAYDSVGRLWKDTTLNAIGGITGSGTSGQVSYFNGTNSITSSPTFAFTPTSQLLVNNSVTASGAIARGINATPTLTAAANNDVLVGLDINPTFTNGAFTGVSNIPLRVNGTVSSTFNISTQYGTTGAAPYNHYLELISTSSTNGYVNFRRGGGQAGVYAYQLNNGTGYFSTNASTGETSLFASSGGFFLNFYSGGTEAMRIFSSTRNVLIQNGGTFTDAGFRLDVNGIARFGSNLSNNDILGNLNFQNGSNIAFIQQANSAIRSLQIPGTAGNSHWIFRNTGATWGLQGIFNDGTFTIQGDQIRFSNASFANTTSFQFLGVTGTQTTNDRNIYIGNNSSPLYGNEKGNNIRLIAGTGGTSGGDRVGGDIYLTPGAGGGVAAAGNVILAHTGSVSQGNVLIGTTTATGANLTTAASITAASAIARGVNFTNTLVAAANNDVLVGLDINPTFTINTALINTSSYLRISGTYAPPSFSANNTVYGIDISPTFTNANLAVGMRINPIFTNVTSGSGWALSIDNSTFGGIRQTSSLIPNNFVGNTYIGSFANFTSSQQLNVNNSIKLGSAGANQHFIIAHSEGGATFSSLANTFNSDAAVMDFRMKGNTTTENAMRIWGTRNITIGSNTDAGFRLDVNGTARVQGNTTIVGDLSVPSGNYMSVNGTGSIFGMRIQSSLLNITAGNTNLAAFDQSLGSGALSLRGVANNNVSGNFIQLQVGSTTTAALTSNAGTANYTAVNITAGYNITGGTHNIIGIYYDPTLTSMTGVTHRAIQTVTGDVLLGTTSGNVMIGTTTAGGRFTIQPTNDQVGMSISGSSLTGSNAQSLVSLSQTWNTTGNPTAIKLDVTNTASGANSYLLDLQVGGIPQFTVFKGGEIKTSSPAGGVAQTWKLGSVQAVTPTSPNRTIEVEVNGTTYYLHAKTTND